MSNLVDLNPYGVYNDLQGRPLNNGQVFIGLPNQDPEQYPAQVYWDAALTIPAALPLRTVGGYVARNGTPAKCYINGNYSLKVKDANDNQVFYLPDYFLIGSDSVVTQTELQAYYSASVKNFTDLRAYTGYSNAVYVTGFVTAGAPVEIAGWFTYDPTDTTTLDDNVNVIVTSGGKRYKRQKNAMSNVGWYNGGLKDKTAFDLSASGSFVPDGSYSLSAFSATPVFATSDEAVTDTTNNLNITYANRSEIVDRYAPRAKQLLHTNAYLMNNYGQGIVNIGDSISHGAYSGNAYTNHWTYLIARAINAEFGNWESVGEFPMTGLYNPIPALVTPQLADVTFSGTDWGALETNPAPYNYPLGNQGAAASEIVNGQSFSSSVNGATITLVVPTISPAISFKYTQQTGGGTFTIKINGTLALTVNTAGTQQYNTNTANVPLVDDGTGTCTVLITKTDANPVEINNLYNLKTANVTITDLNNRMQFHNYAKSGRALKDMTEENITRCCNSAGLIVSLGYNDWFLGADTDNAIFAAFKQRIDWLIHYANVYKTLVVVQDFVWYASLKTSRTRQQLKRLANATRGIYIPYPDQFFSDGSQPTQSPLQLNTPLFLWADAAHPNALGHELIFSTLANAMGFAVNSKQVALRNYDWAYPVKITSTNFANTSPTFISSITTVRQVDDSYQIKINVKLKSTGAFPALTLENLFTGFPTKFRNGEIINLTPTPVVASYNYGAGTVDTYTIVESPATVNLYSRTAGVPGTTEIKSSAIIPKIA